MARPRTSTATAMRSSALRDPRMVQGACRRCYRHINVALIKYWPHLTCT
jgi:hypothetical protein